MKRAKEERNSADTQRGVLEEAELTLGTHTTPDPESPSRSGSVDHDSPRMIGKEEAAGDSSSIDVLYPDPSDSYIGGLFPGSTSFDWSSPDSSGEGRNHEGEQESCEERASRPGTSRIPGKDHRRYYHSHWRLEYLMDFNARSHSMICMVCGSSLATLKLSTIKRHIQQKHPYSLTWTPCEKEVIIGGWDAHLCVDAQTLTGGEEQGADGITITPGSKKKRRRLPLAAKGSWLPVLGSEISLPPPPDRSRIELYMNESFKQWLRLEFLMDYDFQGDKLYCMMCATALQSLSINDIKNHILDTHPTSIYFNSAQKAIIIESWINRKETPEEIVDVEDEMDEDEEEDAEVDLTVQEEDDQVDKTVTEPRQLKNGGKESVNGETKEKGEQKNVAVSGKDGLKPSKAQQLKKSKSEVRNVMLLEEEETRDEKHLEEEERNVKEVNNEDAKATKKLEDQLNTSLLELEKAREAQLLNKEKQKSIEPQLLEEEKLKAGETHIMEEGKNKNEEQLNGKKRLAIETPLLANKALKSKVVQTFEEEQCNTTEEHLEEQCKATHEKEKIGRNHMELMKVKEVQTMPMEQHFVQDNIVKIESEQTVEPVLKNKRQVLTSVVETTNVTIKKEQEKQTSPKLVEEEKKLLIIPEKRIIQVQQVPQAPAVLGIGVPLLKMETPTPIIITRVSVLPEHTVITPPKPKPSTSASDPSKNYRVIAPKVNTEPEDLQLQKPSSSDTTESSQWPAGVDPAIWEVSLWQDNCGNSINTFQCNAYQLRWRSDYLMDYNGLKGSVVCMYCCSTLTVLKDSSIKRHIVQRHPHTSNFTAEQKAAVILDWENKLAEVKKLMAKQNQDGILIDPEVTSFKGSNCDAVEEEEQESSWSGALSEGKGASWEFAFGRAQGAKDPRKYQHDRWKLEFLMDYTPSKDGLICMVCGVTLINPKISTVKMHIQQKHPDTIYLSDQEKAVVIEEWEQRLASKKGNQTGDDEICIEIKEDSATSETRESSEATCAPRTEIILPTIPKVSKPITTLPPPCNSAKRSYQVRWRTEFMMDYDCRRQGLICMVCGGTLATLKVSTIKRHIVQVHPYSVDFTPEERQRILEAYSEMALHYIHSEECFKAQPQEEGKGCKRKAAAMEEA